MTASYPSARILFSACFPSRAVWTVVPRGAQHLIEQVHDDLLVVHHENVARNLGDPGPGFALLGLGLVAHFQNRDFNCEGGSLADHALDRDLAPVLSHQPQREAQPNPVPLPEDLVV
jgi:hypothetical protein